MEHILEMQYPASWWHDMWREGLAAGNGMTGVNLYGGAKREILQLGRHDLWYDGSEEEVPDVQEAFHRLRQKMDEGNFSEASWEIVNALKEKGYDSRLESPLPAAILITEQQPVKGFRSFRRYLDMDRAVASQQWVDGHTMMHREVFVSRVMDMAVYRLRAQGAGTDKARLEYQFELNAFRNEGECPNDAILAVWQAAQTEATCEDGKTGYLYFNSNRPGKNIRRSDFGAVAKIAVTEGSLWCDGGRIRAKGAEQILVTICVYVDEERREAWKKYHDRLAALNKSFEALLEESAALHRELYYSVQLHLGAGDRQVVWQKSNEELLMEAFSDRQSPELIEKLWHYGRYLFICGSSPVSNPFSLYGLWGGGYRLQWCHNMANENLQMIYWHSMCGNLTEYNRSIFRYINNKIPAFKENGRKIFGIDGIYMTAGTTPGVSSPTQIVPVIINWVGAAGWIAQHYYQYFLFTKDREYAREVMLPYMDGVAAFYEEFIRFVTDENGNERIKVYPSVSPENTPANFMPPGGEQMAHPMPTTVNSTIDLAIIKEFFANLLRAVEMCEDISFAQKRMDRWRRILKAVPEFQVNEKGAIREWQEDVFEDRYDHRHLSHLYPVFPGYELYAERNPDKMQAYEKAVSLRRIDAQTGWSMAHMAAVHARLCNGEAAMECLDNLARSSLLNNFFTLHNDWRGMNISLTTDPAPVQLDAVLGYVNAIQEMVLYVAPGYIALLPALEERLSAGKIKNFRYSDGYINMRWNREQGYFECELIPLRVHKVQVALPDFADGARWEGGGQVCAERLRNRVWEVSFQELSPAAVRL